MLSRVGMWGRIDATPLSALNPLRGAIRRRARREGEREGSIAEGLNLGQARTTNDESGTLARMEPNEHVEYVREVQAID